MAEETNIDQNNTDVNVEKDATNTDTTSTKETSVEKVKGLLDDDGKAKDEGEKEDTVVEYQDFEIPENIEINEELMNKFTSLAKDSKLSQESAQALLSLSMENAEKALAQQQDEFLKIRQEWQKNIKEDIEFGGKNFQESIVRAKRTLAKFGSEELTGTLTNSGLGDNPELIKMLIRIDKVIGEDSSIDGDKPKEPFANTFYKNSQHN